MSKIKRFINWLLFHLDPVANDKETQRTYWKPRKKKGHYDLHIKEIKGTKI